MHVGATKKTPPGLSFMVSGAGAPRVKDGFEDHEAVGRGERKEPSFKSESGTRHLTSKARGQNSNMTGKKGWSIVAMVRHKSGKE